MRLTSSASRLRLLAILGTALWLGVAPTGCYYAHLTSGQLRVLLARSPIEDVRSDPRTPERIRTQLELVDATRRFSTELGLDVGGQYTSYVEWPGDRMITAVVATRVGEIEATDFEYPIIGRAPYKGFFEQAGAESLALELRASGFDVCVAPVTAYSTLGWFDDPVTTPMLQRDDPALVETIIHELVHATAFIESQPEFNEGVARFIGQEGSVRFYAQARALEAHDARASLAGSPLALALVRVEENRLVDAELLAFRNRIADLYSTATNAADRTRRREELEQDARQRLSHLPLTLSSALELATRAQLGDACLALRGTYAEDEERHARVLASLGGDLDAFIVRLREAASSSDPRAAFFGDTDNAP